LSDIGQLPEIYPTLIAIEGTLDAKPLFGFLQDLNVVAK